MVYVLQDDHESSQSATDTEMAPPSTAAGEGSDLQTGSEREGGEERDRGKKKETTSKRGRPRGRPRKSTTTLVSVARAESERKGREEEEEGVREQVTRPVSSGDSGQEGERSEGDGGHVDGANLYSPDVDVTSPSRDTIKVGPVRYSHIIIYINNVVHVCTRILDMYMYVYIIYMNMCKCA